MRSNPYRPYPLALRALFLALVLAATACQAKDVSTPAPSVFPANLLGVWQVSEVHKDRGDTKPRGYQYNIHKYLGRMFEFTPQRLTTTASSKNLCETPKVIVHRTTAVRAVSQSLCSRMFEPVQPTPADFGLPLSNNAPVEVLSLLCQDGLYIKGLGGCHNEPPR